jgi:drug/metabolite transporter (DMT)-like permease
MTRKPQDAGRPVAGALWMLSSGLAFVGLTGIVRAIGTDLPAPQQAFLRFAFGLVFLAPALAGTLRAGLPPGALRLVSLRGAVHTVAVICWFFAMARLPVAEVTAIGYLNPVVVMLGGALVFGERLGPARIATAAIALIGAAVILRPGLREIGAGQLAQVAAAVCFAGSYLIAKRLSRVMAATSVVALLSLSATVGLLPLALWVWQPLSAAQALMLAGTAALGSYAHYAMTRAFAAAPLAVTQPVTFLQIVWASLLGWAAFGEAVDVWVVTGAAAIIAAISLSTLSEARASRRAAAGALVP